MNKILFVIGVVGIMGIFTLVVILPVLFFKKQSPPSPQPVSTPTPIEVPYQPKTIPLSPLEKASIGSSDQNLTKLSGFLSITSSPSGVSTYQFQSVYPHVPTIIETHNNSVIFTRTSTYTTQSGGFPSFSSLSALLGKADAIISTNITYGDGVTTYIFASRGLCFIVNDNTGAVYEIMRFVPMNLTLFKETYGEFVAPAPVNKGEGID